MPKKTKKEKLLAHYHKKIRLLESKQTVAHPIQTKVPTLISMSPANKKIATTINEPFNPHFFSDLKKSLILITLIIGLEISLYFAKLVR